MKLKLLITSDAREYSENVSKQLRDAGLDVFSNTVSGSEEFQALAGKFTPDLIILDYSMKSWDGNTALKTALAIFPETPRVVIADGLAAEQKAELVKNGAAACLPGGQLPELAMALSKALNRPEVKEPATPSEEKLTSVPAVIYICAPGEGMKWSILDGDIKSLTGYHKNIFLEKPALWAESINNEDLVAVKKRYQGQAGADCEYRWRRADGTIRWFLDKQNIQTGPDGSPVRITGLVVDITDVKIAANRLSREIKLDAIGRLAGGLAHDFHNLLSSVLGYSTLMLGNLGAEDPLRVDLNEISKAADKAVALTRQLLIFSRKQAVQQQRLDLNSVFSGMQTMVRQMMREDVRGVSDLEKGLPPVKADLLQMEQVIAGLAMFVCELIPAEGTLSVATKTVEINNEYCKSVPGSSPGSFVRLSVAGTGREIGKEDLETIFEPYAKPDGAVNVNTLSLPAIYGIARANGGWATVKSEPGSGTIFDVYLPVAAAEAAALPEPKEIMQTGRISGNGERILLVEDEEGLRKFVGRVLRENGYTVFAAGSVKETLEIFRAEKGNFHMVFTDVVLPDKTGVQLAEELLALKPTLRIIFNSGYINEKSQWPDIQKKGLRFLQKPYTIHNMLTAIKDVINRPEP